MRTEQQIRAALELANKQAIRCQCVDVDSYVAAKMICDALLWVLGEEVEENGVVALHTDAAREMN